MQCRLLGCAVEAWNEQGEPVLGEVGELVCAQPIPSMPLYFVGRQRQRAATSPATSTCTRPATAASPAATWPGAGGVWRHGDWLRIGNPATAAPAA
jgi:acetoacetyl-CoA synthetase